MPFAYYGAKHALARRYPEPVGTVVVEPFAGSAAYSMYHIERLSRVLLFDADPALCAVWDRLKGMTHADIDRLSDELKQERTTEFLIMTSAGGTAVRAGLAGESRAVTPRMVKDWPNLARRIKRKLPHLHTVEIRCGQYTEAPDINATWFIDPPYQTLLGYNSADGAGGGYRYSDAAINFDALGEWCQTRQGLTIVCEQQPAAWLPFRPLTEHKGSTNAVRTEVVWLSDWDQAKYAGNGWRLFTEQDQP